MKKIKILLVDDHRLIKEGVRLMLKLNNDIEVVDDVSNGEEAITYLLNNPKGVDVVLMDINMPEMNGIATTQIITEKFKDIKVLALTMHTEESYITSMIRAGAMGYLLKESSTKELIKAILTVAQGQKYYSNKVSVMMINTMMNGGNTKYGLSPREQEVLICIASGSTNKEIGSIMQISGRSVETHRRNILGKLDLKNSADMIRYAYNNNLLN